MTGHETGAAALATALAPELRTARAAAARMLAHAVRDNAACRLLRLSVAAAPSDTLAALLLQAIADPDLKGAAIAVLQMLADDLDRDGDGPSDLLALAAENLRRSMAGRVASLRHCKNC